jgi:hypothetical protein
MENATSLLFALDKRTYWFYVLPMVTTHRARAIFGFRSNTANVALLAGAKAVYAGVSGNPTFFPNPIPALTLILAQIQALDSAQATVGTRVKGAGTVRNAKRAALVSSLEQLLKYVQGIADAATVEEAVVIIEAAGFKVAKVPSHQKPPISAKPGGSGVMNVYANAKLLSNGSGKQKVFSWEYTLDGGKTFLPMPPTPGAKTSISGLTPLTNVGFRVAVTLHGQPQGPWTAIYNLAVQ